MEVEATPQPDVVQQQQIQALLANVEELTCQNEELWKTMESQKAECRRIDENQNEEESNSQANRRDRTSGEDSTKLENELCNIRKEIDELKSVMKDKGRENLDGMIWRTDLPFTNEVLNRPLLPKFFSHSWSHMMIPRILWITSNHSRRWCYCRWPQTRWCVGHSQQHWKEQPGYGSKR